MVRKSEILLGVALIVIAGIVLVSGCTSSSTPTATPTAAPSATPTATPTPAPVTNITASYNESNNNTAVTARVGDTFQITLNANPSTGYTWNWTATSGLTVLNNTTLPSNSTLAGAPTLEQWTIRANATGNQQFSALYMRLWDPIFGNETKYVLNVTVTA